MQLEKKPMPVNIPCRQYRHAWNNQALAEASREDAQKAKGRKRRGSCYFMDTGHIADLELRIQLAFSRKQAPA
jgi:hypothetical protein